MDKVKVFTFENGKKAYSTGNIEVSFGKKEAVSVEEQTAQEAGVEEIFKE